MKTRITQYAAGVTEPSCWARRVESEVQTAEYQLQSTRLEIARMQRLIDGFELRALGTETRAGQAERAEREARHAVRQAARDAKTEKARILTEKRAIRDAKAAELQARYLGALEALAEKAEATDSLNSTMIRREAQAIVEAWGKEARRTPKVSFNRHELGRDELFVRLGLASRETAAHGTWVRHDEYTIG